jgi:hypothetical protein
MKRALLLLLLTAFPALAGEPGTLSAPPLSEPVLSFERLAANEPERNAIGTRADTGWQQGVPRGPYRVSTGSGLAGDQMAYIAAEPGAARGGNGVLTRSISARGWRGKRVRLSLRLKSEDAASLFLSLRLPSPLIPRSYAMTPAPVTGTTGWQRYDVVLDVPAESVRLVVNVSLTGGKGAAWVDDVRIEPVGSDVAVSRPGKIGYDDWYAHMQGYDEPGCPSCRRGHLQNELDLEKARTPYPAAAQ